jgi:hypothetical protein
MLAGRAAAFLAADAGFQAGFYRSLIEMPRPRVVVSGRECRLFKAEAEGRKTEGAIYNGLSPSFGPIK